MLCCLGEHWGAGISQKGGHEWMGAGRTFFEYFILLFQVCIFFSLSLECVTNPSSQREVRKEILEVCSVML